MDLSIIKITPTVAAEMLEGNTEVNRPIRQLHLAKLVSDMTTGFWDANNGETLKFKSPKNGDKYGTLVDGQHRLQAIIQSGKTFSLPCLIGVSEDAFNTLDSGSSRTFGDILQQKGVTSSNSIAAAVLAVEQFYRGAFSIKTVSHRALLERWNEHKSISDHGFQSARCKKVLKPADAVFLSYVFTNIAPKRGREFIDLIANGGAPADSHVHRLREKLLDLRIRKATGFTYTTRAYIVGSVFKCWNMTKRNSTEEFNMLQIGEDIEYPIGFGKYFTDIEISGVER